MPVEKKQVIARIKAKWPNLNLSQTRLDAIADKLAKLPADGADDAAIDVVLDAQNDVLAFEEIAKMDDRNRTLQAEVEKLKGNPNPPTPPTPPNPPTPPKGDETAEMLKKILEANQALAEKVENLEKGKIVESKQNTLKELFAKSDVFKSLKPEQIAIFQKSIDLDSETPLDEQVKSLEVTAQDLIQTAKDVEGYAPPAGGGGKPTEADAKMVEDIVAKIM
jgi:hypothetical protein